MAHQSNKAFIIGHPVEHSRSPLIHGFWLHEYGLDGSYVRIDVSPNEVAEFLSNLNEKEFVGGNVTIPHKEKVFECLDELTSTARSLQAVNTLYWQEGKLIGDNTDGYGFMTHLKNSLSGNISHIKKVIILGAGGAARPIISSLSSENIEEIVIANRTYERAKDVAEKFSSETCRLLPILWEEISNNLFNADLIVNTTSLGMNGQPELNINFDLISEQNIVYDIVYTPLETKLLKNARAKGAICINGLGMLLHQAVPGFEKWFGRCPEVTLALEEHIIRDLDSSL